MERSPKTKRILFLHESEWQFLLKFCAIFFGLFFALKVIDISAWLKLIAQMETGAINWLGFGAIASGTEILVANKIIEIVPECSGFVMVILLIALLWSNNTDNRRRLKYALLYAPVLLLFNLVRLLPTIIVFAEYPQFFEAFHVGLWVADSAVVMLVWMDAQGIRMGELLVKR